MTIIDLASLSPDAFEPLAELTLAAARDHAPDWLTDLDAARAEITSSIAPDNVARVALDERGAPAGWVGAAHAWGRVWELHPLLVGLEHHGRGYGRRLVRDVEQRARAAGALTMFVATSDSVGATSLGGVDLFDSTIARLARIEIRKRHALAFWQRIGYQVVGVVPDAEGPGWPSISLARRL